MYRKHVVLPCVTFTFYEIYPNPNSSFHILITIFKSPRYFELQLPSSTEISANTTLGRIAWQRQRWISILLLCRCTCVWYDNNNSEVDDDFW